jgi:molecular chaperone IbpA
MVTNTLSIWNDLRPFQVGFDHAFERFNTQLEHTQGSNFPPYNIKKLDNFNWTIEMALAGFNKKDIEVEYADNQLTIKSIFEKDEKVEEDTSTTVHRGISKRQFKKAFTLADEVVVNGAELKDGMLIVDLEKIVPEEKKPRTIKIS